MQQITCSKVISTITHVQSQDQGERAKRLASLPY